MRTTPVTIFTALAAVAVLVACGPALPPTPPPPPPPPPPPAAPTTSSAPIAVAAPAARPQEVEQRGRAWVEAERARYAALDAGNQRGFVTFDDLARGSRDLFHACRDSGTQGDELVQCAQAYLDRATRMRDTTRARVQMGAAGPTEKASADAAVAEAAYWLEAAHH